MLTAKSWSSGFSLWLDGRSSISVLQPTCGRLYHLCHRSEGSGWYSILCIVSSPGGGVPVPFFTLSARIFVVSRPCRVPRTSQHSKLCVSLCMSLLTRACFHGELYRGSRNNKQRMSDVNTRPVSRWLKISATQPTEIMLSIPFSRASHGRWSPKDAFNIVLCWIFNQ